MEEQTPLLVRSLAAGSSASLASTVALAWGGRRDCASALAPVNAVSHWLWREAALHQQQASMRYSLPGYAIHHAMSVLWAVVYEKTLEQAAAGGGAERRAPGPGTMVAAGLGVAALACLVDLKLTPQRLTPGFERRLASGPLAAVYLLFGLGLALPRLLRTLRRDSRHMAC
ncbi:hypothetical protein GPA19_23695 [Azoarcus indigens]|uniref:Uncharacterized protein n=1 Tax=Azoarcus indigens TaxID=29545 RepID=A0A4R6DP14_9RHOO|nr:hypothetical protein [Azoarcus indigens]NMG67950.1 hypothetical protein [Azoarcus indigens]TDN46746.1 hypothetical protein C7389_12653 [Azoarcus indigens]